MILWHCNMVLIFELGSILINHFFNRIRSDLSEYSTLWKQEFDHFDPFVAIEFHFGHWTATSMLATDVGDGLCWWQFWDVGDPLFALKKSPTSLWSCYTIFDEGYSYLWKFPKNNLFGLRYKPLFVNFVLAISLFVNNIVNIFINNDHCTDPNYPLLTCSIHEFWVGFTQKLWVMGLPSAIQWFWHFMCLHLEKTANEIWKFLNLPYVWNT